MAAPRGPSVPAIRYAARRAVARSSLRKVAAEMGMAVSWLNGFVDGKERTLRAKTLRMLREWYMRVGQGLADVDSDTAASALELLTGGILVEEERTKTYDRLVQALARTYSDQGPLPDWVKSLMEPREEPSASAEE